MKIGVSSYSFAQYINAKKMTQKDTVKKAKELGFDCIEFTEMMPPEGTTQEEYAKEIREEAEKCGIEISAYVMGANLAKKDATEEVEKLKKSLDIAKILGVKLFRHDVMFGYEDFRSFDEALPTIAENTRKVTEYAEKLGIRTMTENHGHICQDMDRIERLIYMVNHPNYGLLADMGNFMCADENPVLAFSRLANLAFMVHAKDFKKVNFADYNGEEGYFQTRSCNYLKGVSVGEGDVQAAQCVAILKKVGFDGILDIEYEGREDCIYGMTKGLKFLREII